MAAIIEQDSIAPSTTGVTERRRAGRIANPSPELIALMRKPSAEVRRRLALYDAPNFVPPPVVARPRTNPAHSLRMLCAVSVCVGTWGGMFTAMMMAWG